MKTVDLAATTGLVEAPAGCGKTHSIVTGLQQAGDMEAPWLVLTHTNAGVSALRHRLRRKGVPIDRWRVQTIDAWCIRLITSFPQRSGLDPKILDPAKPDYPGIRNCALELLAAGHLDEAIQASYSRIVVDEYQDCSTDAHQIICVLANLLPTVALGDPLQAIFDFAEPVVEWKQAKADLGEAGQLDEPYRWLKAEAPDLARWLMDIRPDLMSGNPIDLTAAPADHVHFVQATDDGSSYGQAANRKLRVGYKALIMFHGKDTDKQRGAARLLPEAEYVEPVGFKDVVKCMRECPTSSPVVKLGILANQLGAPSTFLDARKMANDARASPADFQADSPQTLLRVVEDDFSWAAASNAFEALMVQPGTSLYRPVALKAARTIFTAALDDDTDLDSIITRVCWEHSNSHRTFRRRAVGSTLLLKGLEAQTAVVFHDGRFTAQNIYVALTRGSKEIVVHGGDPVLVPSARDGL